MASDPRAALEALHDDCTGCGCLGETHAHRAEQALRAVLRECDLLDGLVTGEADQEHPVAAEIRRTITTALEGKAS